jgi:hypothetical protein
MSWPIDHIGPCCPRQAASSVVGVVSGEAGNGEQKMKTDVAVEPAQRVGRSWRDDLPVVARLAGVDLAVHSGGNTQPVGILAVAIAPVVATLAAGALLRGMLRRTFRAQRRWTGLSITVLALSLLGPVSATSLGAGLVLAAMHVVVGAVIVGGLTRKGR